MRVLITAAGVMSLLTGATPALSAHVSTATVIGRVNVVSWQEQRDVQVVKQDRDFSCGAAAVATVLTYFYGMSVSETTDEREGWKGAGCGEGCRMGFIDRSIFWNSPQRRYSP